MSEAFPWDQLEDEPNRWYQRFCAFRLMGPGRTVQGCFNREKAKKGEEKQSSTPGSWTQQSKLWRWVERAEAWDREQTALHEAALEAEWQARIMGSSEVLARLADMARGDIADLMEISTSGYTFKLLVDGPDGQKVVNPNTKLIKKIKQKVTTVLSKTDDGEDREIIESEIELYPADNALVQIGRHHKLFTDSTDLNVVGKVIHVTVGGAELVEDE